MSDSITAVKTCRCCKLDKPMTSVFYRERAPGKFGLDCKACQVAKLKIYAQNNREHIRELERINHAKNPERKRAGALKWQKENPDKANARTKRWRDNNPGAERVRKHRRRAIEQGAEGDHTASDICTLVERAKGKCHWCKKPHKSSYQIDHIIALSKGGSNSKENLCVACAFCNASKKGKMPWEFAGRLF